MYKSDSAQAGDSCGTPLPADPQGPFWRFRRGLLSAVLPIAALFAALFGVLFDLGLNDIGRFHANVDYVYATVSLALLLALLAGWLRQGLVLQLFLLASFLTFVSALVNVPIDQFRGIWFYLLVFVAYMLSGSAAGMAYTGASILAIAAAASAMELLLNDETLVSMVIGLLIFSLLSFVYARQTLCYAGLIESKNQELAYLANRDPLTGILNGRAYDETGEDLLAAVRHSGQPLALLYLDIDHFKAINDTHGHHVGDDVLVCMVRAISGVLRRSDIFARVGGEEFCVLLPGADRDTGLRLAEKVRAAVEAASCEVDGNRFTLTVSIGVSIRRDSDHALVDLEKRADQALYAAKQSGRNRVCVDEADAA
jgi:diguanylate cyclase (GGDEF)-like protein